MDVVALGLAKAEAAKKLPRVALTNKRPYFSPGPAGATGLTFYTRRQQAIGWDSVNGTVFFIDQNGLYSDTYTGYGQNLSGNLGFPLSASGQSIPAMQIRRILNFKGSLYCLTTDQSGGGAFQVYKGAPGSSITWTLVHTGTTGSKAFFGCLATDGTTMWAADYGDPLISTVKSASIWKTTDGAAWTKTWTGGSTVRHVHHIEADPYAAGTVYASYGDGINNCLLKSTDSGATWATIPLPFEFQAVQISFDPKRIYLAPDAQYATLFLMDRNAPTTVQHGAHGDFRNLSLGHFQGLHSYGQTTSGSATFNDFVDLPFTADDIGSKIVGPNIPAGATITAVTNGNTCTLSAAATGTANTTNTALPYRIFRPERPNSEAFLGVVDPATGIYYGLANATSVDLISFNGGNLSGGRNALFYVPTPGAAPVLLDVPPGEGTYSARGVFIAGGRLYYGTGSMPLLTTAAAAL